MNQDTQFKLQAYLDGELTPVERAQVESLLAQDAGAKALLTELQHTAGVISSYETGIKLPEAREFYWSKIQREIQRPAMPTRKTSPSLATWLRRILIPGGALAALLVVVLFSFPRSGSATDYFSASGDAVAFTYHNYNTGTTLVWLDFSENNFSDAESDDTIDL